MGVWMGMGVWGYPMHICMYMHACTHARMHMHVKHDKHGCLHVSGHLQFIYMYTCACMCVYGCTCMCMHVGTPHAPR